MNGFLWANMVSLVIEVQFLIPLKNDRFVAIPFVPKYPRNIQELCNDLHISSHFLFLNRLYDAGMLIALFSRFVALLA
jgi:hypothetical protein